MAERLETRESLPGDLTSIEALYPQAFPDEDLRPLVEDLLRDRQDVLSLVGIIGEALVGHAVFTTCGLAGRRDKVALLK